MKQPLEEVIKDFKEVHKDKYDYSKVVYRGSKTKVTIVCKVHGEFEQIPNNHKMGKACTKCGYNIGLERPTVFGIGINDADYVKSWKDKNGKTITCPIYVKWHSMIRRCYSPIYQAYDPSYTGCSVSKEWHRFSTYKAWMETQDYKDKHLDKDLLVEGNRVYSKETCLFISPYINSLITYSAKRKGPYPTGVSIDRRHRTRNYMASIGKKHLGRFKTPEEASIVYKKAKGLQLLEVAKDIKDERVVNALRRRANKLLNKKEIRMVEFKKRFVNEDTLLYLKDKDIGNMQKQLIASRVKVEDVEDFCNVEEDLMLPFLKDKKLKEAAYLLKKHIEAGSSILVHVDNDKDGLSSGAIANLFFKKELNMTPVELKDENDTSDSTNYMTNPPTTKDNLPYEDKILKKGELIIIVNDRMYGNGVNLQHAKSILKLKPDLIITADHGSADHKSFELIKDVLPDTVILVTDHHVVPEGKIPICDAFVNPQDKDSTLGEQLCGAAVLYLLFRAYSNKPLEYLYPIVGAASIVDQMSLGESYNRFLYRMANKHLKSFLPFREYIRYAKHRYLWSTEFYSIGLGPLVNSTKRMNVPIIGYRFMTATTKEDVFKYYIKMTKTNKSRKDQQVKVETSIEASVRKDRDMFKHSRVAISDMKNGVNGILASRLVESDYVPSFVFNKSGNIYEGSGRGYGDFNIEGLIATFKSVYPGGYISGGGHHGAGGLKLKQNSMHLFRALFERLGSKVTANAVEYFDIQLPLVSLSDKRFRKEIRDLQPFGRGFDYPVFKVEGSIQGYKNYGPSFYIYKILDNNGNKYSMMRFSELREMSYLTTITLYVSPRGKSDYILLDAEENRSV